MKGTLVFLILLSVELFAGCAAPAPVSPAAIPTNAHSPTIPRTPSPTPKAAPSVTDTPTVVAATSPVTRTLPSMHPTQIPTSLPPFKELLAASVLRLGKGTPNSMEVARESKLVAIATPRGIFVYRISETKQAMQIAPIWEEWIEEGVSQVAISTDGEVLAGLTGSAIRLWNGKSGAKGHSIAIAPPETGNADTKIALSPDGKTLAAITRAKDIAFWETPREARFLDSQTLIVSTGDSGVRVIGLESEKTPALLNDFTPQAPVFSPDGKKPDERSRQSKLYFLGYPFGGSLAQGSSVRGHPSPWA